MIARISTDLPCTEGDLWQRIVEPKSLQYAASPVLSFVPADGGGLDKERVIEKVYDMKLSFLNIIPLGRHSIRIVTIDKETNTIVSRESGSLARVRRFSCRRSR